MHAPTHYRHHVVTNFSALALLTLRDNPAEYVIAKQSPSACHRRVTVPAIDGSRRWRYDSNGTVSGKPGAVYRWIAHLGKAGFLCTRLERLPFICR